MNNPFKPRIGAVMSADIAVPRHDEMVQFYSQVLTTGEHPWWQADLMNNKGTPVIGLGTQSPEYANLPLQWMPHMQVADVAESVNQALNLGGTEVMHSKDDEGHSQWAVIKDPNGAAFGLIPLVTEDMVPDHDSKKAIDFGHIAWLDLTIPNAESTRDFYQAVIGWQVEDVMMQDGGGTYTDYNMLGSDDQPAAGVCHAKGTNKQLPPVWLIYLPVGDLLTSIEKVEQNAGKIITTYLNKAGKITQVVIQDPIGVYLALCEVE